jgi:hypothetical protein
MMMMDHHHRARNPTEAACRLALLGTQSPVIPATVRQSSRGVHGSSIWPLRRSYDHHVPFCVRGGGSPRRAGAGYESLSGALVAARAELLACTAAGEAVTVAVTAGVTGVTAEAGDPIPPSAENP